LHNIVTLKTFGLLPEGHDQSGAATHTFETTDSVQAQLAKVLGAEVGDLVLL
jgi:hypothetical protein